MDLYEPRSVMDVGCGKGEWLEAFGLDDMCGIDIAAPDDLLFFRYDLVEPIDMGRYFDLVLSLEVGEHLPASAVQNYVNTLTRHSDTVVFSAAVPGQEGIGHINCQPHEFWHEQFAERGFEVADVIRPRIQDHRVSPWYRNNIFAYVK